MQKKLCLSSDNFIVFFPRLGVTFYTPIAIRNNKNTKIKHLSTGVYIVPLDCRLGVVSQSFLSMGFCRC